MDYSSIVTIQNFLRGEQGADVHFGYIDNEEHVTVYAPVEGYRFGVAVIQPTRVAFAGRNQHFVGMVLASMFIFFVV